MKRLALSGILIVKLIISGKQLGYEPAGLTVHPPPPPRMIEGGFIIFAWVSSATKKFS